MSPQSSLARMNGGEGYPIVVDASNPATGSFYMISFASVAQLSERHTSNGLNLTGYSFPAGFNLGGVHTLVDLTSGHAVVYGNLS